MNIQKPQKILLENLLDISDLLSLDFSDNYIKSINLSQFNNENTILNNIEFENSIFEKVWI